MYASAHHWAYVDLSLFLWFRSSLLFLSYLHLSLASPLLPYCLTGHVMSLSLSLLIIRPEGDFVTM